MTAASDLAGIRFGKLVCLHRVPSIRGHARWLVQCDCGSVCERDASVMKVGNSTHCGCSPHARTHGLSYSRLHRIWRAIRQRCSNPKVSQYYNYGGRGIKVCKEWEAFEPFMVWALSNGYSETLEIDRIDNDGDYEPTNCRFATSSQQKRNTRITTMVEYHGKVMPLADLADQLGIPKNTIVGRMKRQGMTLEQAITLPRVTWETRRLSRCFS